ncbi:MAG: IMP dehydrogenase [Candidatus Marinimicrobia bacterium]|nr:IMP dehydrogenase [Candidatus Neomarinimicrobiota bacterium]
MAKKIIKEPSRTLMEYRLLPGYTTHETSIDNISLETCLAWSPEGEWKMKLNIPIVSAAMQSVSGVEMGIELARLGGLAFIFCSQTVENEAAMIRDIKSYKAGFVDPFYVNPDMLIGEVFEISKSKGFNTFPVVDVNHRLLGILTKNDYSGTHHASLKVSERMIPRKDLVVGVNILDIKEANAILRESHQSVLPIVNEENQLKFLVFRKDIRNHMNYPQELLDEQKRLLTGAAINTYDYEERVPALVEAGVDIVAVDSSDGFSFYQKNTLAWISKNYPSLPVIGGNIITKEGFRFLVDCGARAVKVGMGGGSICITQEQKGTGRGLATAIIEVVAERDRYYKETGRYIPVVADGGIVDSKDITIAIALGADYVMMGRYFARMEESPTEKIQIGSRIMKPYWGEGSARAREWKSSRYYQMKFAEGVEGFVQYAGKLRDNLPETLAKIKASMSSCGVKNIPEFHQKAELEVVSALSIREGKVHDIYMPEELAEYKSEKY